MIDGVLQNRVEPGKHLGNLRTEREFEDFNIKLEVRTQANSNSGIYQGRVAVDTVNFNGKSQFKFQKYLLHALVY